MMRAYLARIAAWLSQGVHCVVLGGHHDMTVSARCYVEWRILGNRRWRWAHDAIDLVFYVTLDQRDHCARSFVDDVAYAREVLQWLKTHTS